MARTKGIPQTKHLLSGMTTPNSEFSQDDLTVEEILKLDRYAPIFIPDWLKRVNQVPCQIIPPQPSELTFINYDIYRDALFPRLLQGIMVEQINNNRARISKKLIVLPPISNLNRPPIISHKIIPQRPMGMGNNRPIVVNNIKDSSIVRMEEIKKVNVVEGGGKEKKLKGLPNLQVDTYAHRFLPLLRVELDARTALLNEANLYAVPITPLLPPSLQNHNQLHPNNKPILFSLAAKSIREGWPPVDLGDLLQLRQVRREIFNFQGVCFDATVVSLNRASGTLVIRCDSLIGNARESMMFNVIWLPQIRNFQSWGAGVETVHLALNPPPEEKLLQLKGNRSIAECWLFPEIEDGLIEDLSIEEKFLVHDSGMLELNREQRYACQSIVWGKHKIPYLISGPPGTGKTKTLVATILQILIKHPTTSILVCGASNPSADTLAIRLRQSLSPKEMFRLNSPSRPLDEVRGEILPFCHVGEGEKFGLPSFSELLSKRVIVTTLLDSSILLQARCTNRDLAKLQAFTLSSLNPHSPLLKTSPHFGFLLVDEAAQASEPDITCAIGVVLTEDNLTTKSHITICGDQFQLGPEIISEEARTLELDVSFFGRLMERKVYFNHPFMRGNLGNRKNGELEGQGEAGDRWKLGIPFVNLTKNYRSATPILMLPSTLFYNDTLEPFAPKSTQDSLLKTWNLLPTPNFPILFRGISGLDEPIDEGASFYNEMEIQMVCDLIENLIRGTGETTSHLEPNLKPSEISVITPFREQVWRIRLKLRGMKLGDVDVGNVESLQGAENRVIIISTVRSRTRFIPLDRARSKGIIHEPRRFNVAMTRAKELLIVVGNPKVLVLDPWWKAFYRFCKRNGCYEGFEIQDSESNLGAGSQYISRLESEFRSFNKLNSYSKGSSHSKKDSISNGINGSGLNGNGHHVHELNVVEKEGREEEEQEEEEEEEVDQDQDFDYLVGSLIRSTLEE